MVKETNTTKIAVMANDIAYIKKAVEEISSRLNDDFVTKEEFVPVKQIVYGLVGLILTAVCVALVALVVRGQPL